MSQQPQHDGDIAFEPVPSEEADGDAALNTYEIVTYPADYTLSVLVDKWRRGQVKIPRFQRNFVWKQSQASRLIESFLIGLPVPSIFLYTDRNDMNNQLVVDGQQRLNAIAYFFEGYFGEENSSGRRQVFKLMGLHESSPFLGKTYADLEIDDPAAWNRLNDSVLRAFVIQQLDPADDTSIYHVFERLNNGGTQLSPQEIRNAVNHGPFNELLHQLNDWSGWRWLWGSADPDKRQRDVEMVLRVIALAEDGDNYEKPMKEFLNRFMRKQRGASEADLASLRANFERAVKVAQVLGPRPFRRSAGFNAAIFDGVMTAILKSDVATVDASDFKARYEALLADKDFIAMTSSGTTDEEVLLKRIALASTRLLG